MLIALEVDTDNNANTGSPEGTEYAIEIFQGEAALFRWDGTNFTRRPGDPPFTSLLFSYQGGITVRMSAAELGNTKAFKFAAFVFSGIAVDPVTERSRLHERRGRRGAGGGRGAVRVPGEGHAGDARRGADHHGQGDSREAIHGANGRGALGYERRRAERPRDLCGTHRQRAAQGARPDASSPAPRRARGTSRPTPRARGSAARCRSCSRASGPQRASRRESASARPVRRLALLASLLVAVAVTGTAAGSVDRTPRSVIERAHREGPPRSRRLELPEDR